MLVPRSGETEELIAIVVFVTHYLSPCLSRIDMVILVAQ